MKLETGKMKLELFLACALAGCAGIASMAGTATATKVVVQNQFENQRQGYVGKAGELVLTVDDPFFPLVVHDGSTTGGVRMVSASGALPRVTTVVVTNNAEWVGWATTGELAGNALRLESGEWVESPILKGGISSYDDSGIHSEQNGTAYTLVVYTNTTAAPVELPYTGTDARLRITAGGSVAMGATDTALFIDSMSIISYSHPELLALDATVSQFKVVNPPHSAESVARFDTVQAAQAAALAYTDREIIKYDRDTDKVVRGAMVFAGSGWLFQPTATDSNATMQIAWRGFPAMEFDLGVAGCTIDTFVVAANALTATFGISTTGCASAPVVEYCTNLATFDWRSTEISSSSYPALVDGKYEVVIDLPDTDTAYYRALRQDGPSRTEVKTDVFNLGQAGLVFTAVSNTTTYAATLRWDAVNKVFVVSEEEL